MRPLPTAAMALATALAAGLAACAASGTAAPAGRAGTAQAQAGDERAPMTPVAANTAAAAPASSAALPEPPPAAAAPTPAPEPRRLTTRTRGLPVEVEVRDLPRARAEAALHAAAAELTTTLAELRPEAPALAALAAQPDRAHALGERATAAIAAAQAFCTWSEGRVGPLGGRAYALWGMYGPAPAIPGPADLEEAVTSADCTRLVVDVAAGTARLAAGSAVELWGFELGFAVDRAAEVLRAAGAGNFWLRLGAVYRAAGPGPAAVGWRLALPHFPGQDEPLSAILLHDHAFAVVTPGDRTLEIGGDRFAPYLDLRTGRPATGLVAVLVGAPKALEAQALAMTMFVAGPRQGSLLLGSVRPSPSIRWLIGGGTSEPLISDYHWSDLRY